MKPEEKTFYTIVFFDSESQLAKVHLFSSHAKAEDARTKIINGCKKIHSHNDDGNRGYFKLDKASQHYWKFKYEEGYGWLIFRKDTLMLAGDDNFVYVLSRANFNPHSYEINLSVNFFTSSKRAKQACEDITTGLAQSEDHEIKIRSDNHTDVYSNDEFQGWVDVQKQPIV